MTESRRSNWARRRDAVLWRRSTAGVAVGVVGLVMSAFAYTLTLPPPRHEASRHQVSEHLTQGQAAAPSEQTTGQNPSPPAESKPGGTRPTTPAPEPARPDPEARKQGAPAALPPAPAEKTAPPIERK